MVQTWLWLGMFGMAIGAVFFGFGAHNAHTDRWKILYLAFLLHSSNDKNFGKRSKFSPDRVI